MITSEAHQNAKPPCIAYGKFVRPVVEIKQIKCQVLLSEVLLSDGKFVRPVVEIKQIKCQVLLSEVLLSG